jgi:MOSC domain-containing protein YiiM
MAGRLLQLSVKPKTPGEHGLPKLAESELLIDAGGARGDYNHYRTRTLQGDPDQAMLVLTTEVLDGLRAEGWPVRPGDLGENLTLEGVPEAALRPGTRLRLGAVELEVTRPCEPCSELYTLPYVGPARGPAFLRALTGRRGWYARVSATGRVTLDTPVELHAAAPA